MRKKRKGGRKGDKGEEKKRKGARQSKSHKTVFFKLWVVFHPQSWSTFIKKTKISTRESIREHCT